MFLRGLALGFLNEALGCSGASFPGRPLMLPLERGSLGSSAPDPLTWGLLGEVSEVPLTELLRDSGVSVLLGVSRGVALGVGSGRFQGPAPLLDLEIGTTLRICSFSEEFKVRTGLVVTPWLRRALTGFEAPTEASLKEFLFGAIASFPLLGLSFGRPPWQLSSLLLDFGAGTSPGGLETELEETWLLPASPAPEDTEPSPSFSSSCLSPPALESIPSEQSRVSEQSVVSETYNRDLASLSSVSVTTTDTRASLLGSSEMVLSSSPAGLRTSWVSVFLGGRLSPPAAKDCELLSPGDGSFVGQKSFRVSWDPSSRLLGLWRSNWVSPVTNSCSLTPRSNGKSGGLCVGPKPTGSLFLFRRLGLLRPASGRGEAGSSRQVVGS